MSQVNESIVGAGSRDGKEGRDQRVCEKKQGRSERSKAREVGLVLT